MGHDPDVPGMIEAFEDEISKKESYIEFLHEKYISTNEKLEELISYLESDAYGNLISKSIILRALRKLKDEL
jgi:hypothetical protein